MLLGELIETRTAAGAVLLSLPWLNSRPPRRRIVDNDEEEVQPLILR